MQSSLGDKIETIITTTRYRSRKSHAHAVFACAVAACVFGLAAEARAQVGGQTQELSAAGPTAVDSFGTSLAIDGDTLLVGAIGNPTQAGGVYEFSRTAGVGWAQSSQFMNPNDVTVDQLFGGSVTISGLTSVVGAPGKAFGQVYVFEKQNAGWVQTAKLVPKENHAGDAFGASIALQGDTLVASAASDTPAGAVYVFNRSADVWTETVKLLPPADAVNPKAFGTRIALDGTTLVVTDEVDDAGKGAAYVFVLGASGWTEQQKLVPQAAMAGTAAGQALAYQGDTIAIASPRGNPGGMPDQGLAWVFTRSGSTWSEQATLQASDGKAGYAFGDTAAIDGQHLVIGGMTPAAAYRFELASNTWKQTNLFASKLNPMATLLPVQIQGDTVVVGNQVGLAANPAPNTTTGGVVYVYTTAPLASGLCVDDSACASNHCVDGVCCDTACGGGDTTDCQACSKNAGAPVDGTCSPASASYTCRPIASACDVAEHCDGKTLTCPSDALAPAGTPCPDGMCEEGACVSASPSTSSSSSSSSGAGGGGGSAALQSNSPSPADTGGCGCRAAVRDRDDHTPLFTMLGLSCLLAMARRRRR